MRKLSLRKFSLKKFFLRKLFMGEFFGRKNVPERLHKIIGGFFCGLLLVTSLPGRVLAEEETAPADLSLYATAAVLMDADSGRVLYGKNQDTALAMASTTKIMTCIEILENVDLDDTLTVSAYAASMPKVKLYLKKGEQYQVRELLYSLMLESHNDSAVALAEYLGKQYLSEELKNKDTAEFSVEESRQAVAAFAALMNQKASSLGCEQTYFITPNGLDATETITLENGETVTKEHCTTAAELARIMSYCITKSPKRDVFLEITRTANYSFSANGRSFSCNNHNAFLSMMDGALSGKTGFTNKAGYCYVGSLVRDDRTFVVALLGCGWPNHKTYKWSDTRELMQYGIDNYFYRSFSDESVAFDESSLQPIPVSFGQTQVLGGTAYTAIKIAGREEGGNGSLDTLADTGSEEQLKGLLMKPDEQVQVTCRVKTNLDAPVSEGTIVGDISYAVDDQVYYTEMIVTGQTVERIDLQWCMEQVWGRFCPL